MVTQTQGFLFVFFAFFVQILLLINFTARNLRPELERKYGWVIYALGIPALLLGVWSLAAGRWWLETAAYFVFVLWTGFGGYVDRYRQLEWRSPPRWPIFIPYIGLFIAAQLLFWIPLWYYGLIYWGAYTILYVLNTVVNIISHRR